jgi:hypothetical protein
MAAAVPQVGQCIDNQGFAPNGDAVQHTSGGLLVWRKADNWTAFTDGNSTWINGPNGIQSRLNTDRFEWEARIPDGPKPGDILYADGLTDPNAGQLSKTSDQPNMYNLGYRPDGYQIQMGIANSGRHVYLPGQYGDSKIGVDAFLVGDVDKRYYGVWCRVQTDGQSGYAFGVYPGDGSFFLNRLDGGQTVTLARDRSKDVKPGNGVNHLEMTCNGSSLTGTVNGVLVATSTDQKYTAGRLAISAGSNSVPMDSRLLNLVVWQP